VKEAGELIGMERIESSQGLQTHTQKNGFPLSLPRIWEIKSQKFR
jgi:hypothetical protein